MAMLVIDDNTNVAAIVGGPTGLESRDYNEHPFGASPFAETFKLPLIPRHEWAPRRKELVATKSRLSDIRLGAGLKSSNQGQTNYCWAHGPVNAVRLVRAANNQPGVDLSAASVAAPAKGYRNLGGWGHQALARLASHGAAAHKFWPENAIDPRHDTPECRANAALHKVSEWWDLQPRNLDQLMTCLLLRIPVAVGYNWWGHEVVALDPVDDDAILIWNSWDDSWGDNGFAVIRGARVLPDDAVAPRVVTASAA